MSSACVATPSCCDFSIAVQDLHYIRIVSLVHFCQHLCLIVLSQEKEIPKSNDGQLSLRVIRAMDLQETGVIKYQDPFVVMETNRARFETTVAKGAGRDPEWKEAFEFQVPSGNAALQDASIML